MAIGDWVRIFGVTWDVRVISIKESFSIIYSENTGKTLDVGAPITLDPLGTYFSHVVTFGKIKGKEYQFDKLFDELSKPRYNGIDVEIVHNQMRSMKYKAYVSAGSRDVKRIDEKGQRVDWDIFEATFTPIRAQIVPSA